MEESRGFHSTSFVLLKFCYGNKIQYSVWNGVGERNAWNEWVTFIEQVWHKVRMTTFFNCSKYLLAYTR